MKPFVAWVQAQGRSLGAQLSISRETDEEHESHWLIWSGRSAWGRRGYHGEMKWTYELASPVAQASAAGLVMLVVRAASACSFSGDPAA